MDCGREEPVTLSLSPESDLEGMAACYAKTQECFAANGVSCSVPLPRAAQTPAGPPS